MHRIWMLALLSSVFAVQAATVHRWVDADGQVHFGDAPPEGAGAETIEVNTEGNTQLLPEWSGTLPPAEKQRKKTDNNGMLDFLKQRDRREREEKCIDYEARLDNLRSRMRAGYRASQHNKLLTQERDLKQKIETYCK